MATPEQFAEAVKSALETSNQIQAVSIKIPPFWARDSKLWFSQLDRQFVVKGITTSLTKFNHVVASLEPQFATIVRDIVENPPATEPYEFLKEQLILRTTESKHARIRRVLRPEPLGDRKPSEYLRNMRALLDGNDAGEILRTQFIENMPESLQPILASMSTKTLDELASTADNMLDVASPPKAAVYAVEDLTAIRSEITALRTAIRGGTSEKRKGEDELRDDECWDHKRFKNNTQQCRPSCRRWENFQAGRH